jgi:hypothetical protein
MSRGILYIVWGERAEQALKRSLTSLKDVHPELPYEVVRLPPDTNEFSGLIHKSRMMSLSPFDETLFLDADTVVLDRLDFGFSRAIRFGIACCICESPWSRRYRGLPDDDAIEYNTGVIFFTRQAKDLFESWEQIAPKLDSSIDFVDQKGQPHVMPFNDQGSFAQAMNSWSAAPFVLPLNWNFRPMYHWNFFGPIKIWHGYDDVPLPLKRMAAYYQHTDSIIQFHILQKPT